ncbi:MAG: ROK family protein [Clostridia bacterium]|nr:ROK family protein [Clostridia bacterium]
MYYVGIDVGGMSVKCGFVAPTGKIVAKSTIVTDLSLGQEKLVSDIAEMIANTAKNAGIKKSEYKTVGVGIPGTVDVKSREVKYSCNLFKEVFPIGKMLEEKTGLKVRVANDADCAAYGECLFGAGSGKEDLILVTLGTGVGTGIVTGGKPFAGGRGMGGEGGHVYVGGKVKCSCGRIGCFETEVSATALIRKTEEAIKIDENGILAQVKEKNGKVDGRTLFEGMKMGDEVAKAVFSEFCKMLGEGLVNFANVFRPEMILIGGGISAEGKILTDPVQEYVDKYIYGGTSVARTVIGTATLGNDAGIIGAAFL